jgi:hypothetical protein
VLGASGAMIPAKAGTTWLTGWQYRKAITINNTQNSNSLTDYQVKIVMDTASLISAGKLKADGSDLRFTDSDGSTLLSYWIQEGINTTNTIIWIKVPSIPASSTKTIYVYYGNSQASSLSNGTATFLTFDNFDDETITDWTASMSDVSISESGGLQKLSLSSDIYDKGSGAYRSTIFNDGIEIIAKAKLVTATTDSGFGLMLRFSDDSNAYFFYWGIYGSGEFHLSKVIGGTVTDLAKKDDTGKPTLGQFYILHFAVSPNGNLYVNVEGYNTLQATDTARTSGKVGTYIRGTSPAEADYDWFFVKKYIPPEPTSSLGSEEVYTPPASGSDPVMTLNTDKTLYSAGEKIMIYGTVTYNNTALKNVKVQVSVNQTTLDVLSTDAMGTYKINYTIPIFLLGTKTFVIQAIDLNHSITLQKVVYAVSFLQPNSTKSITNTSTWSKYLILLWSKSSGIIGYLSNLLHLPSSIVTILLILIIAGFILWLITKAWKFLLIMLIIAVILAFLGLL